MKRLVSYQLSLVATPTNQSKVKETWEDLGECVGLFCEIKRLQCSCPDYQVMFEWSTHPPHELIGSVLQAFVLLLLDRDVSQERSQKMLQTRGRIRKSESDGGILQGAVTDAMQVAKSLSHKPLLQSHIRRWIRHGNTGALVKLVDSPSFTPFKLETILSKIDGNNNGKEPEMLISMCEFVVASNQLLQQYTMLNN